LNAFRFVFSPPQVGSRPQTSRKTQFEATQPLRYLLTNNNLTKFIKLMPSLINVFIINLYRIDFQSTFIDLI